MPFMRFNADPSVTKYTEGLYPERAKEEAYLKDYTENMYYFYNYGVWTICDRMTGQVIGRAGFSNREGCEDPELGFVIGVRGSGRDMLRRCVRHCWNTGKRNWDLNRCRCW